MRRSVLFFLLMMLVSVPVTAKPGSPLALDARLQTPWLAGELVEVVVQVASRLGLDEVVLRLLPEDGVELLDGPAVWRGALVAGEARVFHFQARVPVDGGGRLRVELATGHDGRPRYLARRLLPQPRARGKAGPETDFLRIERQGRGVREYRLP